MRWSERVGLYTDSNDFPLFRVNIPFILLGGSIFYNFSKKNIFLHQEIKTETIENEIFSFHFMKEEKNTI